LRWQGFVMDMKKEYKQRDSEEKKVQLPLDLAEMKMGRRLGQIRRLKSRSGEVSQLNIYIDSVSGASSLKA
jgi:hypothetical protein